MSELSKEYAGAGKLSDDSFKQLEDAGFPRGVVEAYIRGVEQQSGSVAQKDVDEILTAVGGTQKYEQMMSWAQKSFSTEEQKAYNHAVTFGDKHIAKLAVQGMVARYEAEFGKEPKLVGGDGKSSTEGSEKFKTRSDMIAAMSDKKYGKDPDYTREVAQKVINSGLMKVRNQ